MWGEVRVVAIRVLALLLVFALAAPLPGAVAMNIRRAPMQRALLVGCDDFVTQPDTTPSTLNNIINLRRALLSDRRAYRAIKVSVNEALDVDSFSALVREAFAGAAQQDTSLFYLSTHGLRVKGQDDFYALFSDGRKESLLSGAAIHAALSRVPGRKVVILDACYSGAAILKGMDSPIAFSRFSGPDFKVLTSSGGLEPSFLWTDGAGTVQGGSFFAQALTEGISADGNFAADLNRDGTITLAELHRHLLKAYGASTPQVYPQQDDYAVFQYEGDRPARRLRAVTGLELENPLILEQSQPITFSYTLNREARLAYQLIYDHQGGWRFESPQSIPESGRGDGLVLPGRKSAALRLQDGLGDLSGYLLLMLITVAEDRSRPQACVLLGVHTQAAAQPALSLQGSGGFSPARGEEAAFILRHQGIVRYSAAILDAQGRPVIYLAYGQMSRPLHLAEEGSGLWWSGRLADGSPAPTGQYRLRLQVDAGRERHEVLGGWFTLQEAISD